MPQTARADVVGSLIRPPALQDARRALAEGRLSAAQVRAVEDKVVLDHISLQERAGLDVVSDGEARRTNWIASIGVTADGSYTPPMAGFEPVEVAAPPWMAFWRNQRGERSGFARRAWPVVTRPISLQRDLPGDEFGFLKAHTRLRGKYTFPAPSYHRVFWHPELSSGAYATVDAFLVAVRDFIREHVVERVISLGCDYVQMDAPNYGQTYTDPEVRAVFEAQGHDLQAELAADAELDNSLFEGIDGVTRALHICRGNGPGGAWSATGGYDTFAASAFPRLTNYDTLLLEYDTPRAGDFSPLQHVLPGQAVVLGLLTTKEGALEDAALVEQRIHEAARFVPLERLALSTQCGFASAGAGNPITPAEQEAKLRRVVEVARKVWS